jgi:hypothetical protein
MKINGFAPVVMPAPPERAARPAAPAAPQASAPARDTADISMPAGSDPALWSVLTAEERAFFLRQAAMGPVTYGPSRASAPVADLPTGQRIDVRA